MNANQFFQVLFGDCLAKNGGFIEVRQPPKHKFFKTVQEVIAYSDSLKENVYFGVCPRKKHDGTKAGVLHVVALWADVDYGKEGHRGQTKCATREEAWSAIINFEIEPSIIVSTGHGFQVYWLLKEPEAITDSGRLSKIERILKGIATVIQGDGAVAEVAHILRVPGTINQKPPDKQGNKPEPRPVEILKLETGLRYDLRAFTNFEDEKAPAVKPLGEMFWDQVEPVNIETLNVSPKIRDLIKSGYTEGGEYRSRSECDQAVVTALVSNKYGPGFIRSIFSDENNKIGEKYREKGADGEGYLRMSIQNAERYTQKTENLDCQNNCLPVFPLEAFPKNGFLGEYVQFASKYTDAPVQYHVATALSVLSTIVNRKVFINWGLKKMFGVLWVVVLGESGYRKTTSQDIGMDLLIDVQSDLKASNEFSKEGLIEEMSKNSKRILAFSELAVLLTSLETNYNRGLKPMMIDIFDAPRKYERITLKSGFCSIEEPFINILAATTNALLIENIKEDDLRSGFLPRFIFICANKKNGSLPKPPDVDVKWRNKLIKMLKKAYKRHGEVKFSPEAEKIYTEWYLLREKKLEREILSGLLHPFYVRLNDYLLKIAMLFAINDESRTISEANMRQGIVLVDYLTNNLRYYLMNELTFSPFAKDKKKIMELIVKAGPKGITHAKLLRHSNKKAKELGELVTTFKESEDIYEQSGPKGGKIYVSMEFKTV